jgi:hypothetical protein
MRTHTLAAGVLGTLLLVGCGGGQDSASGPGASGPLDITFSDPADPRAGENTFEVRVTQGGQPVTDADVAVELYMAPMPSMNMPEMRNTVALAHASAGRYRGTGTVMMSGPWTATVTVSRGGTRLGEAKIPLTAQ